MRKSFLVRVGVICRWCLVTVQIRAKAPYMYLSRAALYGIVAYAHVEWCVQKTMH